MFLFLPLPSYFVYSQSTSLCVPVSGSDTVVHIGRTAARQNPRRTSFVRDTSGFNERFWGIIAFCETELRHIQSRRAPL